MSARAPAPVLPKAGAWVSPWCRAERPTTGGGAGARLPDGRRYHLISGRPIQDRPEMDGQEPTWILGDHEVTRNWWRTSTIVPPPSTWARSSGRQRLPESLENGQFERIESRGFQTELLGFLKLRSGPITLAPGVIGPGQVEGEARVPRRLLPDRQQVLYGPVDLAQLDPRHGARVGQGGGLAPNLDGPIDQR